MAIIILGLGPGDPGWLTIEARRILEGAGEVHLRTRRHPTVAYLPEHLSVHSFDYLYEQLDEFAAVYEAITEEVLSLAQRPEGVIYAVPGHPWVGEATTVLICQAAREQNIPVRVVAGISFLEPLLSAVGLDPVDGLQVTDAMLLASAHHPQLAADQPTVIAQCYDRTLASDVKLTLLNAYPDDHPVTVVRSAGTQEEQLLTVALYELDREDHFDHLTSLYLPPVKAPGSYGALHELVAHLRAPDGCPWDQEQTHQSLRTGLLEETYELLAALDADDAAKMQEELGDMLLQLMLHIQIASEEGEFKLPDVVEGIVSKLVRRHPHVFGGREVDGIGEVLSNWEEIKRGERTAEGHHGGPLDGLPPTLPALTQAQAYQRRFARVGYETLAALDLNEEETATVRAVVEGIGEGPGAADKLGARLLALAELARRREIDLEDAVRSASARLAARYSEETSDG